MAEPAAIGEIDNTDQIRVMLYQSGRPVHTPLQNLVNIAVPLFRTAVLVEAATISSSVLELRTAGYYTVGDGGDALYKWVAAEPTHEGKLQSANGRWFELVVGLATTVNAYGAYGDNTSSITGDGHDDTLAIQGMIDHVGYYRLGLGRYKITEPLFLYSATGSPTSIGVLCHGVGKEKSALVAFGMAGKSMLKPSPDTGLHRIHLAHHRMFGDADTCVNYTLASGQLYESTFNEMLFESDAEASFIANRHFATSWYGCSFSSEDGDSVKLQGGNSTVLTNCYAHECGAGKSNFRIGGYATLINCLGGDTTTGGTYVFHVGGDPFATGVNNVMQIHILGGNAEDFGTAAIAVDAGGGQLIVENLAMVARASGTYETAIKIISGTAASVWIRGNTRLSTKGATRSGSSNIQGTGGVFLVENQSNTTTGSFPDFYNTTSSLLTEIPILQVRGGALGTQDLQISRLKSGLESGFIAPVAVTFTANASTFSVASQNSVKTANTVATDLTNFTDGVENQTLKLLVKDANTTIKHDAGGAGEIWLTSGADYLAANGEVLEFIFHSPRWYQIGSRQKIRASATVDPASIALDACTTPATITVTGAALGDFVTASFSLDLAGASLRAYVSAANTVTYFFRNDVGANPLDLGSGTLRVEVTKAA
ncbi:hypothetical protein [Mesorhizobium wenxiniae]|uniref:Pectate lyase superfamily protein domain-containing protein n=1 Tax=Mesorhizobium wenxiniae TaxID=2014805 RepID=A0A271KDW8_9HYPH|nr:hypothetical protein [Mesorhizobium wenxiniae]PAP93982.1 hypothetical protein CIT31_16580 [Mesorhizobium wenxiniae]